MLSSNLSIYYRSQQGKDDPGHRPAPMHPSSEETNDINSQDLFEKKEGQTSNNDIYIHTPWKKKRERRRTTHQKLIKKRNEHNYTIILEKQYVK